MTLQFRRYGAHDADAVATLDEWAMQETATDPGDIPGREDIAEIETVYFESGGTFVVGVLDSAAGNAEADDPETACELPDERATQVETEDGLVVAMGGALPSEAGHEDERTVAGAVELHRMRVAPPCQHSGYGTALLAALERRVTAAGYERILATTARRQQAAAAFYPAAGYERVDTSTYGEYDLLHFEKTVDA
jgi:GNAT superfamily N-acetyltransferase